MKTLAIKFFIVMITSQNIFAMGSSTLTCISNDKKIVFSDENGFSNIELKGKKEIVSIENYSLDLNLSNKIFWNSKNKILTSENLSNDCGVHHEIEEFQNEVKFISSSGGELTAPVLCKEEVIISIINEQNEYENCN